jgi:outer membrane protein
MKVILTLLCCALFWANAQTKIISLDEAQKIAIEQNTQIKNARIDLDIAKEKIWETTAIGLPQINAEGGFQNFIELPTTVLPANAFNPNAPEGELIGLQFGTNYNVTGNITLTQLIFDGRYFVGLQASRAVSQLYQKSITKTEIDVKKSVAQAYYTAVATKVTISKLEEINTELQSIFSATKKIADLGLIEKADAEQLAITLRGIENNLASAKVQHEIAKNLLKLEMGMALEEAIDIAESLDYFLADAKIAGDLLFNPSANINYDLMSTQLVLSKLSLKNQKATALPTLAGFMQHQQQALRNDFTFFQSGQAWYPSTLWGLKLTIPIFSSGMRVSQINQAKFEVKKLENNLEQLDAALKLQFMQAKLNFEMALTSLGLEEKNVASSKIILHNTQVKFQEKMVSSIEFSQAQNQYLMAQANYINAAYKLLIAKNELNYLMNK